MIQWIKRLLFKGDYEDLQVTIDSFYKYKLEEENRIATENRDFNEKKDKWEKEEQITYRESLAKYNLQSLQDYKDKLETLIDYRLIPWAKVWVFTPHIHWKPEQIEIESVYINKEKVSINNDMNLKYFHSKKEAVDFYNNYLDKQKITLDSNS